MNMPNRVKRLKAIVRQHHLAVCPPLVVKKPPPKKIKRRNSIQLYSASYLSTLDNYT